LFKKKERDVDSNLIKQNNNNNNKIIKFGKYINEDTPKRKRES